jgi:hypothetical protein
MWRTLSVPIKFRRRCLQELFPIAEVLVWTPCTSPGPKTEQPTPRCKWGRRSSGMLRRVDWYSFLDWWVQQTVSKRRQLSTDQQSVIFQKSEDPNNLFWCLWGKSWCLYRDCRSIVSFKGEIFKRNGRNGSILQRQQYRICLRDGTNTPPLKTQ